MEGNGRAWDGDMAGDGDATRHGGAAEDGLHVGARSFYSHRIGGPVGRGGGWVAWPRYVHIVPESKSRLKRYVHYVRWDAPQKLGVRCLGAWIL